MPLTDKERIELFGTRVFATQLRKYIEAKKEVGKDSIIKLFPDIKRKTLENALKRLTDKNIIIKDAGIYKAVKDTSMEIPKVDAVWRATQLLQTFKAEDLQRITGYDLKSINKDLNAWVKNADVIKIGKDGQKAIYKVMTISCAKPIGIYGRRKKHGKKSTNKTDTCSKKSS